MYDHEEKKIYTHYGRSPKMLPKNVEALFCFEYVKNDSTNKQKVLNGTVKK